MKRILSAQQVEDALNRLFTAILAALPAEGHVGVIGVRTRGEPLARRIFERIASERPDLKLDFGILDITFYRDDLSLQGGAPEVRATEINFDLDDTYLLLVDDVLQTGRSVRAALGAIHDFGRPRVVRLAVLVDRGGHELPISADYFGQQVLVEPNQFIHVKLKETDGEEGVFIVKKRS